MNGKQECISFSALSLLPICKLFPKMLVVFHGSNKTKRGDGIFLAKTFLEKGIKKAFTQTVDVVAVTQEIEKLICGKVLLVDGKKGRRKDGWKVD